MWNLITMNILWNILTKKRNADEEALTHSSSSHPFKKSSNSSSNDSNQLPDNVNQNSNAARIFELPKDIFHIIVTFISLKEMSKLDASIFNNIDRIKYFDLMENVTIKTYETVKSFPQFNWIHSRKVTLERIEICVQVKRNYLADFRSFRWENVKQLTLRNLGCDRHQLDSKVAIECLLKCTSLERLGLHGSYSSKRVTKYYLNSLLTIFDHQEFCERLKKVCLDEIFSSDAALLALSKHNRNLVDITFSPKNIDNSIMTQFFSSCGLTLEKLRWSLSTDEEDFTDYLQYCPQLKIIPTIIRNSELLTVAQYCPDLTDIKIKSTWGDGEIKELNDESMITFSEGCRKLETLSIYLSNISDAAMIRVFQNCSNLRHLSLGLHSVTHKCLQSLSVSCPLLVDLNLDGAHICGIISNFSFPCLTSFHHYGYGLCDSAFELFVQNSPNLKVIDLYYSHNVTNIGIHHIASHCHNLEKLSLEHLHDQPEPKTLIKILRNNPRLKKSGLYIDPIHDPLTDCIARFWKSE